MRFENIYKRINTEIQKISKKYFVAGGVVILALILVIIIYGINGNGGKEVILSENKNVEKIELTSTPTISIKTDKKVTATPTGVTANQANDTNTSSNNPQPTATITNIVATLTPTKIPTLVPTVTSTPYIQPSPKASPTITSAPTLNPTQTPVTAVPTETVVLTPTPGQIVSKVYIKALYHSGNNDIWVSNAPVKIINKSTGEIFECLTDQDGKSVDWYIPANTNVEVFLYKPRDWNGNYCGSSWNVNTGPYGTTQAQHLRIYDTATPCITE